jgi:UDP-N-acetylmuramate dehydrogenase
MKVVEHPSLKALNTFGVKAAAGLLLEIEREEDLLTAPAFDPTRDVVLGGGSNIVFASDVPGTVFHIGIRGRSLVEDRGDQVLLEVGAGEDWHGLVRWTLEQGYYGLENLSLIPGRVGAAPIQNIGAYGVELGSVLDCVTAWEWRRAAWLRFDREACRLSYRDSLFKSDACDRYLLTSIRLLLGRRFVPQLEYAGLRDELQAAGINRPTALDVSDAVIRIRRRKLPDPAVCGNAGSFFKNPVVDADSADALIARNPGLAHWPLGDGRSKLSAAWLVEQCGLKGLHENGAAVSRQHALVIVNRGDAGGADIIRLARRVQAAVNERYGVALEPEPRLIEFPA